MGSTFKVNESMQSLVELDLKVKEQNSSSTRVKVVKPKRSITQKSIIKQKTLRMIQKSISKKKINDDSDYQTARSLSPNYIKETVESMYSENMDGKNAAYKTVD